MSKFQNAVAVVTGAGSGIGAALAKALAAQGAQVAVADVSEEAASAVAAAVGAGARAYRCDVTERGDLEALASAVERDFGGVDLAFANAGVYAGGKLTEADPREFEWLFDVNVRGVFNTVQAFAPALLARAGAGRRTRFVITGSENSVGLPVKVMSTGYTATKHALLAIADGLRRDLDGSGVGVSIFCPGPVNTRLWDAKRWRHDRYGGGRPATGATAEANAKILAEIGQDPDLTARLCLEGVAEDEFIIITDPKIRELAVRRHREVEAALDRLDARLEAMHA